MFGTFQPNVIFVDECSESVDAQKSALTSNSGLPLVSDSIVPAVAPQSTTYPLPDSDNSSVLAEGLAKDKIFINKAQKSK